MSSAVSSDVFRSDCSCTLFQRTAPLQRLEAVWEFPLRFAQLSEPVACVRKTLIWYNKPRRRGSLMKGVEDLFAHHLHCTTCLPVCQPHFCLIILICCCLYSFHALKGSLSELLILGPGNLNPIHSHVSPSLHIPAHPFSVRHIGASPMWLNWPDNWFL